MLFEGIEVGVEAQTETAAELWSQYGTVWIASEEESREMWRPMPLPTVRLKLAVPVASLPAVLVAAETILGGIPSGHLHGHAGSGIALIDLPSVPDELPAVIVSLRRVAERGGGSLVVQRAPAEALPSLDVWGESAAFPLMRRVKAAFDGTGTLNPGRFVGGL